MAISKDFRDTASRFSSYISRLVDLCKSNAISGWRAPSQLLRTFRADSDFRAKWTAIWLEISEHEGGKLSLTTAAAIIGLVFGGLGVAAFGTAIGVPLAFVLVPIAYLAGEEVDSRGWMRRQINTLFGSASSTAPKTESEADPTVEVVSPDGAENLSEVLVHSQAAVAGLEELNTEMDKLRADFLELRRTSEINLGIGQRNADHMLRLDSYLVTLLARTEDSNNRLRVIESDLSLQKAQLAAMQDLQDSRWRTALILLILTLCTVGAAALFVLR